MRGVLEVGRVAIRRENYIRLRLPRLTYIGARVHDDVGAGNGILIYKACDPGWLRQRNVVHGVSVVQRRKDVHLQRYTIQPGLCVVMPLRMTHPHKHWRSYKCSADKGNVVYNVRLPSAL